MFNHLNLELFVICCLDSTELTNSCRVVLKLRMWVCVRKFVYNTTVSCEMCSNTKKCLGNSCLSSLVCFVAWWLKVILRLKTNLTSSTSVAEMCRCLFWVFLWGLYIEVFNWKWTRSLSVMVYRERKTESDQQLWAQRQSLSPAGDKREKHWHVSMCGC